MMFSSSFPLIFHSARWRRKSASGDATLLQRYWIHGVVRQRLRTTCSGAIARPAAQYCIGLLPCVASVDRSCACLLAAGPVIAGSPVAHRTSTPLLGRCD